MQDKRDMRRIEPWSRGGSKGGGARRLDKGLWFLKAHLQE
jgi:hypothetical protein